MNALPVIDVNAIESSNEVVKIQKGKEVETINCTSADLANNMIAAITSGKIDPLVFAVKRKLIVDAFNMAFENADVKQLMLDEQAKHGKECFVLGAKISIRPYPKYKYDQDQKWNQLTEEAKPYVDKIKQHEELLKAASKMGKSFLDEETGELINPVPAPSSDSLIVSFSKK